MYYVFCRWKEKNRNKSDAENIEALLEAITMADRKDLAEELREQYVGM